ncbi:hypothetical protein DFH29DRAFT_1078223 [Suillus ampliporus]|nr:hypothetical protein DFH29DRAFT_1078223 [Suillus ampliporus]
MSYLNLNGARPIYYYIYDNQGVMHPVVQNLQSSGHPSFGANRIASTLFSHTFYNVDIFVPMNIPQHNKDDSLTVLFHVDDEMDCLSFPSLRECRRLDGGPRLKNPQEIMFPTLNRTQSPVLKLVIAWPGYDTVEYPIEIGTIEKPITRGQLARQIARAFFAFFNSDAVTLTQRSHPWKIGGPDGYSFHDMHLSAFWNIEGNAWGASIKVLKHT